ncbi:MAG: hypothetical protein WEB78_10345 [Ilumatobacteraceae bacterium]
MEPTPSPSRGRNVLAGLEALDAPSAAPRPAADHRDAPRGPRPSPARPARGSTRQAIRTTGPFVALIPPAILGVAALVALRDSTGVNRGVPGFVAAVLAAPLLPVLGAPMRSGTSLYLIAAAGSAVVWMVLGAIAAARATRDPAACWGRFWSEYLWLMICVWIGVVLSVVLTDLVLGRVLV